MGAYWIDLLDPTRDELLHRLPAGVDPNVVDWLESSPDRLMQRPVLEDHGSYVFGCLVSPFRQEDEEVRYVELGVVVTRDLLLTVRHTSHGRAYDPVSLPAAGAGAAPGVLLHRLLDEVAESFLDLLDELFADLDELEDGIGDFESRRLQDGMRRLRHDIVHARRTAALTRATLRGVVDGRIDLGSDALFPPELERSYAGTAEKYLRVTEELDVARDLLSGLRDFHHARIAEAQNDVVKKLTVIASLVLVPTLVTGFFGQNFQGAFEDSYWRLSVSIMLIAASTVLQLLVFRWRRWL